MCACGHETSTCRDEKSCATGNVDHSTRAEIADGQPYQEAHNRPNRETLGGFVDFFLSLECHRLFFVLEVLYTAALHGGWPIFFSLLTTAFASCHR